MVVDTISYLNADYLFQAIELDTDDQQQFLNKFTTGDGYSELTLVYKTRFNTLLSEGAFKPRTSRKIRISEALASRSKIHKY
jgi:hypothetical protein